MKSISIMDNILRKYQKNHDLTDEQVMSVVDYLCGSGDIRNLYNYYGHEIMS
jgi:hypothetical protein